MFVILEIFYHCCVGACFAFLLIKTSKLARVNQFLFLLFAAFAGIFPDIPHVLFGDNFCHAIWISPILGLVFALVARYFIREMKLIYLWISMSGAVIVGHLFMDMIDNGDTLFYPFIPTKYALNLVVKGDQFIVIVLFLSILIGLLFYKKSKIIILIGMITATSYLGLRSYSKFEVHQNLEQIYRYPDVKITVIPLELFSKSPWSYLVASKDFNSGGTSSFSSKIYRDYLFFQMQWNVLKEIRKDNATYIICESMKNKGNLTVFRTINNINWDQVTNEKEKQLIISEFSS